RLPAIDKTPDRVIRLWRKPTWSLSFWQKQKNLRFYHILKVITNIVIHSKVIVKKNTYLIPVQIMFL
ncbi:hypothetical protein, partial [Enterococcus malodoratus]|uniref:hypothetical protein n=1 Tax=Enterococcus malodoratus TaxID=71451 RepID=UPI0022E7F121